MRIAGGVLLLIAALFNLFGGLGYLGAGGCAAKLGQAGGELASTVAKEGARAGQIRAVARKVRAAGGSLMLFGLSLLVTCGLQIGAAGQLFRARARGFILVVAVLGVLVELGGGALTTFGVTNGLGLVASVFAALGASSIKS